MARLIYVFLACALATLIAGFLIRDSSVPLFVSIGLSALVLVMILFGTSRRLRRDTAVDVDETELAELEIVELDEDSAPAAVGEQSEFARPSRRKATPRTRPAARTAPPATETREEEPTIAAPETPAPARRRVPRADETAPTETVQIDEPPPGRRRKPRTSGRPAGPSEDTAVVAQSPAPGRKVWVIPGRSRYHSASCRFAKGDQLREVTETTARRRGYVPCNVCRPDQGPA